MVSKNEIKLITSLAKKKYRYKHLLFVAEGEKLLQDLLESDYKPHKLYTTETPTFTIDKNLIELVSVSEMQKISQLATPSSFLGVFYIPKKDKMLPNGLQLVLDGIKDPGNLGTIIRLCDWFGVSNLVCSEDSVDCYNPKVVQATMGSLAGVTITYTNIKEYLEKSSLPKFLTLLEGENIYEQKLPKEAIIVMGNEANGIRESLYELADYKITIPKFGKSTTAESLNVAMATAVCLSEFRK